MFASPRTGAATGTRAPHSHGAGQLIARLRARAAVPVRESGYTLIETMIAMMLLLGRDRGRVRCRVARCSAASMLTTNRFTAEGEAQTIADRITKDLRAAVTTSATGAAFASADVNDVTFYANLADPNGPTKLHAYLTLQPGTNVYLFHEDATAPDAGGSIGNYTYSAHAVDPHRRQVPRHDPADLLVLRRQQQSDPDADHRRRRACASIDSVAINLRVRVTPTSPIVVINTVVHIRNTDYNPNT